MKKILFLTTFIVFNLVFSDFKSEIKKSLYFLEEVLVIKKGAKLNSLIFFIQFF